MKFKPKPGQVDFTHARFAPVINCVVQYRKKILIVERSKKLHFYPGCWNGISGFLDDKKSLEEKVREELKQELGIRRNHVRTIRVGKIFHQDEPRYKKTWIVHPVLVRVDTNKVHLDWEARNYKWILPREVRQYALLPGFGKVIRMFSL